MKFDKEEVTGRSMKKKSKIISCLLLVVLMLQLALPGSFNNYAYADDSLNNSANITEDSSKNDTADNLVDGSIDGSENNLDKPSEDNSTGDSDESSDGSLENDLADDPIDKPEEGLVEDSDNETITNPEEDIVDGSENNVVNSQVAKLALNMPEDIDGNGIVNDADLAIVSAKYNLTNKQSGYDAKCDLNGDGIIDVYDLTRVSSKIGASKIIAIDPGHGGSDPGALGPNLTREKDITLKVGLKVRDLLQSYGYSVVMTRTGDYRLSEDLSTDLLKRAQVANDNNADLFVSIHNNSASSPAATGTETFVHNSQTSSSDAYKLASNIQNKLIGALALPNRGVKYADFSVLRNTKMPAVLTELAFINNPKEEALLITDEFQNKAAKAIVDGILGYFK